MGFATHTQVQGSAGLFQELLSIVTELDRRGALAAVGADALVDVGRRCVLAREPQPVRRAAVEAPVGQASAMS